MFSEKLDVSGIDPAMVLVALYNNAKPLGMGFLHYDPTPMTVEEARQLLAERAINGVAYFDYLQGRVMKVAIGESILDARLYDRDNGPGAAERAIKAL